MNYKYFLLFRNWRCGIMPPATLKSIAKATGYSVTTVSRALGGYDDVNAETRRIITEEAEKQGYRPNLQARLLQGQRSQTIGLVLPMPSAKRFTDPFFSELISGVGTQASSVGFDLLLSTHHPAQDEIQLYKHMIASRRVDGFVVARTRHEDQRISYLQEINVPFVVFGRTDSTQDYPCIDLDGAAGQHLLTQHFIKRGHKRIAYITPPKTLKFTQYRMEGFLSAMREQSIPVVEEFIIEGELDEDSGWHHTHDLLAKPSPPTAIMTGNDVMAFGVMRAIQERGKRVGGDIAVGGFDNLPLAEYVHPGLTTINQSIYDIGWQLTEILLQIIAGDAPPSSTLLIPPELVIRESSAKSKK
jgi:LacI family transcriptional regulator